VRQHGHASVDAHDPRAWGVCDRCGFVYNHSELQWQWQWVGPRLQNLRRLVCQTCLDTPQEQLRTIVLPPDPEPIQNARPEDYVSHDNPMSGIGVSANWALPQYGSVFGNLTAGGGLNAAVDGNVNKPSATCASNTISNSSFDNYVGINWQGSVTNLAMPSSLYPPIIKHSLLGFTLTAPLDRGFLGSAATEYVVQGADVPSVWATWTTISSGTTAGTNGETITSTAAANGLYPYHRVAFLGDQLNYVAVAQISLDVAQIGEPE
jgi:hypothetical protein